MVLILSSSRSDVSDVWVECSASLHGYDSFVWVMAWSDAWLQPGFCFLLNSNFWLYKSELDAFPASPAVGPRVRTVKGLWFAV